jgi:hypothetical protein
MPNPNNLNWSQIANRQRYPVIEAVRSHQAKTPIARYNLRYSQTFREVRRRDPENHFSKFFTDGLVSCGLLLDDSWEQIEDFKHTRPEICPTISPTTTIIIDVL